MSMKGKVPVLIRQRIVDELLRDTSRLYDKYELTEAVLKRVTYLGYDTYGLSVRTIDGDIKLFRDHGMELCEDKAGRANKPLRYKNPQQRNPVFGHLEDSDMDILHQAINLVDSMGDEPQFRWAKIFLSAISSQNKNELDEPFVDFHIAELEGLHYFDKLLSVCIRHQPVEIEYAPFNHPMEHHVISPYQLRHFNDRWYLIGFSHNGTRDHFAFDRIVSIKESKTEAFKPARKQFISQYDGFIGVSHKPGDMREHIDILVTPERYNYIRTKKIHSSQFDTTNNYDDTGRIHVKLYVAINKELIASLLSFGNDVEVMAPKSLRETMKEKIREMSELYK